MRIPYIAATLALGLVACQKTASTNDNIAMTTNDSTMTTNDSSMSANSMDSNMAAATGSIDKTFVTDAIKGDNSEVAIGKLALANGASSKVKDFGQLLVTDHGAHKDKLAAMATSAGLAVPDGPTAEGQTNIDKLKALKGAAFDAAFKSAMIEDHQKDIAKYEKQAAGTDAQTAAMAKDTLPTLRKHLDAAKAL